MVAILIRRRNDKIKGGHRGNEISIKSKRKIYFKFIQDYFTESMKSLEGFLEKKNYQQFMNFIAVLDNQ